MGAKVILSFRQGCLPQGLDWHRPRLSKEPGWGQVLGRGSRIKCSPLKHGDQSLDQKERERDRERKAMLVCNCSDGVAWVGGPGHSLASLFMVQGQ